MELPNIGQHCSESDCKQLDFLPLTCKCGKQFCTEHFNLHVKNCEVLIREKDTELKKFKNSYTCSQVDCKETSLVPLICERCQKHFCIKHRHLTECFAKNEATLALEREKYAAPVKQFNEAKVAVDKQIEQNMKEAKKKGKNIEMINKIQLMKIKNKAKGPATIPANNRVYFNILHPPTNQVTAVFVSKVWSVGRAIDSIATECKLENYNNKSVGTKLRIFKSETGEIITTNMSDLMQSLLESNVIFDGEKLVLDYVNVNLG